ncbi:MAG TPA: hypothetical protein ENJ31_03595 [Anaerolineae bacterium]|nr:hypothetical protein [Anaerolineae bacterium]
MKRPRLRLQLTYRQHLALAVILVVLLAVSLLYCLGFASLALHHAWETNQLPGNGGGSPVNGLEMPFAPLPPATATPSPP